MACSDSTRINAPDDPDDSQVIQSENISNPSKRSSSSSAKLSSSSVSSSSTRPWNPWGNWYQKPSSSQSKSSSSSQNWWTPKSSSSQGSNNRGVAELNTNTSCQVIRSTTNKFSKLQDILPCVKANEKVAFVIRHAARNKSASGDQAGLNDEGRKQAKAFGEELKDIGDVFFMHTKVYRSMETVLKIVEGKGQKFSENKVPFAYKNGLDHEESSDLEESYVIKNQSAFDNNCRNQFDWGWSPYTYYAFEENVSQGCKNAFYDADDRLAELVQSHFTYDKMHDITIAISHDKLLIPFVIAASKRQIDLRFHKHENQDKQFNYWINYLTGLAVIVGPTESPLILPTTALDDPILRVFPDN